MFSTSPLSLCFNSFTSSCNHISRIKKHKFLNMVLTRRSILFMDKMLLCRNGKLYPHRQNYPDLKIFRSWKKCQICPFSANETNKQYTYENNISILILLFQYCMIKSPKQIFCGQTIYVITFPVCLRKNIYFVHFFC